MWESVVSIIVKYWIEVLLGLIVTSCGLFFRRYINLSRAERDQKRQNSQKELIKTITDDNQKLINEVSSSLQKVASKSIEGDEKLQKQINKIEHEMSDVKVGITSMQRQDFLDRCRFLLQEDHIITTDEWEAIDEYYDWYKALGGNHKGDVYFAQIKKKYDAQKIIK